MATHESTTYEGQLLDNNIVTASARANQETVDDSVVALLPQDTRIISATGYGASFWTRTVRVETELAADKSQKAYFLKACCLCSVLRLYTHVHVQISDAEGARKMMHGEYESQKALYDFVPSFIPKPINWGTYTDKKTHFFLSEFIEMTDNIPPPPKFCAKLAELHSKSMQKSSPGGKFGFHLDTCQGNILLTNDWCDKWEKYFRRAMEEMIKREQLTQGPCPEIDRLQKPLVEKVIPRLLRPLESNGRSIRPCLVHGDLWHGNTSVSSDTNEPYAFDSCASWAHNEYEMGMWRASRYKFGRAYLREYHRVIPVSAPEDDWDDRNALYAIRVDLLWSALYDSNQRFRQLAIDEMKRLVDLYPDGYQDDALVHDGNAEGPLRLG